MEKILILWNYIQYFLYIGLFYLLSLFFTVTSLNYVLRSLFFIKPMKKKYQILEKSLNTSTIKDRYLLITFSLLIILINIYFLYLFNIKLFHIEIILLIIYSMLKYKKYLNYTLLHYINEFSEDLFDWDKIYELPIDINIKKGCFQIHNKDYYEFEKKYTKLKQYKIQKNI